MNTTNNLNSNDKENGAELISKKDLLDLTGISYGQLYRWKRKSLIPEEWFIKKSTFTGQETFFPKVKVLQRIDRIKDMKDDVSLDDLAEVFSPQLADIILSEGELLTKNIVTQMTLDIYKEIEGEVKVFSFEKVLLIAVLEKFLISGQASIEEAKGILKTLALHYRKFEGENCEVVLIRKFGVAICLLISTSNRIYLEENARLVMKVNLSECIEELKIKAVD